MPFYMLENVLEKIDQKKRSRFVPLIAIVFLDVQKQFKNTFNYGIPC